MLFINLVRMSKRTPMFNNNRRCGTFSCTKIVVIVKMSLLRRRE